MRSFLYILLIISVAAAACGRNKQPATPVETLKAYTIAVKNKDTTMMKLLLSEATLKLHQDEAKARGVTLDEIVGQQTLFPADQKFYNYRNEKIEGDKASVEVENSFGGWDTVFLVKENGAWKIDKKSTADQMIESVDEENRKLDELINKGKEADEGIPTPAESPSQSPVDVATPSPSGTVTPPTVPAAKPSIPSQTPPSAN